MAEKEKKEPEKKLFPAVAHYGPANLRDLKKGDVKRWCVCGLSKNQPWCDGSHKETGFSSLEWKVPSDQAVWSICMCKYTKTPPYCDGSHVALPEGFEERKKTCPRQKDTHVKECKLCTSCGWVPDF